MAARDLIISSRHLNMVAALDGRTRAVKWIQIGRRSGSTAPACCRTAGSWCSTIVAASGSWAARASSRCASGARIETIYPRPDAPAEPDFWSEQQGFLDPNHDGKRLLVTMGQRGLVIEIDLASGRTLWELVNSHDLGSHGPELGAAEDRLCA